MKLRQFAITLGLTVVAIACAESLARAYLPDRNFHIAESPTTAETIQTLANASVAGREIDNRFTVTNIAKLSRHPHPDSITTAFLGTSRTKVLHPELINWQNAVVSAGNSYNEISYSYLIEASFLKQQFPNLKYVFVETSLLNRQEPPPAFIVSPDHRKYLPFLVSLQKELAKTPSAKGIATLLAQQEAQSKSLKNGLNSSLFTQRDRFRISTLLELNETQQTHLASETEVFQQLNENGVQIQRSLTDGPSNEEARLNSPKIQADDPKITRLTHIKSYYPWDEQFTALVDWAKVKGVTLVFFQPPVRSDFYAFQVQYGIEMHRQAMIELAQDKQVPFIDLNVRSLNYIDDWSLFSDADHMGSCKSLYLYPLALQLGLERWQSQGQLLPSVSLQETTRATKQLKTACSIGK
jgi:hypothetical protein